MANTNTLTMCTYQSADVLSLDDAYAIIEHTVSRVQSVSPTHLFVFPEMFVSGYVQGVYLIEPLCLTNFAKEKIAFLKLPNEIVAKVSKLSHKLQ